jgi:hypothetical protein
MVPYSVLHGYGARPKLSDEVVHIGHRGRVPHRRDIPTAPAQTCPNKYYTLAPKILDESGFVPRSRKEKVPKEPDDFSGHGPNTYLRKKLFGESRSTRD